MVIPGEDDGAALADFAVSPGRSRHRQNPNTVAIPRSTWQDPGDTLSEQAASARENMVPPKERE